MEAEGTYISEDTESSVSDRRSVALVSLLGLTIDWKH
jgi:hypothetical protein